MALFLYFLYFVNRDGTIKAVGVAAIAMILLAWFFYIQKTKRIEKYVNEEAVYTPLELCPYDIVEMGKRKVLHYDDRLYIVFEDNVTEIEIRYKRAGVRH